MKSKEPESAPVDDREQVSPERAARRLYDEMALAYREQAAEDLALNYELFAAWTRND